MYLHVSIVSTSTKCLPNAQCLCHTCINVCTCTCVSVLYMPEATLIFPFSIVSGVCLSFFLSFFLSDNICIHVYMCVCVCVCTCTCVHVCVLYVHVLLFSYTLIIRTLPRQSSFFHFYKELVALQD